MRRSDGATKRRWMGLPEGQAIEFSASGPWSFPEGTVFVKQFDLALDEREPSRLTRLETRLLVAGAGGEYYGMTYRWNAAGTDAELVTEPLFEDLTVIDRDGNPRAQTWFYPGPRDCATCHSGEKLTNNASVEVHTGGAFQVPSLRGLAWRAPYMHQGCAPTLNARFDAACGGGDAHGHTSQLTAQERADLVAYLDTL